MQVHRLTVIFRKGHSLNHASRDSALGEGANKKASLFREVARRRRDGRSQDERNMEILL